MNKQFSSLLIKICILVGAFFLGLAARSHAQTIPPHRPWRHRGDVIHFTPEQRRQLKAINKDYHLKAANLFEQDNLTLKQYKASLLVLQKEKKQKLAAILTPEQKDRLAIHRKRRTENARVRQAAHLERLKLRLDLTDDQVAKLQSEQETLRSQAQAIRVNDNLLRQEKRQQVKALMAKRNDTFRSVLTPDQYSRFEKMFHHHPGGLGRPGRRFDGPNGPGGTKGPDAPAGSAAI